MRFARIIGPVPSKVNGKRAPILASWRFEVYFMDEGPA
jgi:hypothetical protein